MSSARVHIAMVGTTAAGHVLPGLAVVRELVRRRHRVTYAIGDALAPLVAATGAEPVGLRGVPAVAIPRSMDQFANAARVEAIGAGVRLAVERVTPGALRAAVERLTDPAVAARMAALRAQVRAEGGAGAAADAIEEALRGR